MRTTIKAVNAALLAAGHEGVELRRARDYVYFSGPNCPDFHTSIVGGVRIVSQVSVDVYVRDYQSKLEEFEQYRSN